MTDEEGKMNKALFDGFNFAIDLVEHIRSNEFVGIASDLRAALIAVAEGDVTLRESNSEPTNLPEQEDASHRLRARRGRMFDREIAKTIITFSSISK